MKPKSVKDRISHYVYYLNYLPFEYNEFLIKGLTKLFHRMMKERKK